MPYRKDEFPPYIDCLGILERIYIDRHLNIDTERLKELL